MSRAGVLIVSARLETGHPCVAWAGPRAAHAVMGALAREATLGRAA